MAAHNGILELIKAELAEENKPVVAGQFMANSKAMQAHFKNDVDALSRYLAGLYKGKNIARGVVHDPNFPMAKYGYAFEGTPGSAMVKVKKPHRVEKMNGKLKLPPVKRKGVEQIITTTPTEEPHDPDAVVIETGTLRITMSMGRIIMEPRRPRR